MRQILAGLLILIASTLSGAAQTISVRGGEHQGFTRLVFDLPRALNWELETGDGTATLGFGGGSFRFDFKSAFVKIGRTRVSKVSKLETKNNILINLACDCEVVGFLHTSKMLVLDVRDRKSKNEIGTGTSTALVTTRTAPKQRRPDPTIWPKQDAGGLEKMLDTYLPNKERTVQDKLVKEAKTRLLRQLSRAASQGLLLPKEQTLVTGSAHMKNPLVGPKVDPQTKPSSTTLRAKSQINLRAESSVDHDFVKLLGDVPSALNGGTCAEDNDFSISDWGNGENFASEVGRQRAMLFGEFDKPSSNAAISLVKTYIYFGFGIEAIDVLSLLQNETAATQKLMSIARILDNGYDSEETPFKDQADCDSIGALWAILSQKSILPSLEIDQDALMRGFNALPFHLRSHLGPTLSQRLLSAGHTESAKSILRMAERGADKLTAPLEMAAASILTAEGDIESAKTSFSAVISANDALSPDALVALIDASFDSKSAIPRDLANLAAGFALEYRDQQINTDLKRVQILALAANNEFEAAFNVFESVRLELDHQSLSNLGSKVLLLLAEKADDATFVTSILEQDIILPKDIGTKVANVIGARLIHLGLFSGAQDYLSIDANGTALTKQRVLRAQLALAQRRPRRALAELINVAGREVAAVRASAQLMAGDFSAAQMGYIQLEKNEEATRTAMLAEDWKYLMNSETPELASVANLLAQPPTVLDDTSLEKGPLAKNRDLLARSEAARSSLVLLLEKTPMPPEPTAKH